MSNTVDFIADMLKKVSADIAELKVAVAEIRDNNTLSAQSADTMYRALNIKLDLIQNLDVKSTAAITQAATARTTKQSRPMFFKMVFGESRDKYIGKLYTQEDMDVVLKDDRVVKSKAGATQNNRIANILYNEYVKTNPDNMAAFETIYAAHFA